MSGRLTGVGGMESEWRPSQHPVRKTYWSWMEGVRVETVSTACPGDLLELEGRSPSGDRLNSMSLRPTGAGGKESECMETVSTACPRDLLTYWSWREGVRVETVSTACPGDLMELEGRSPSGDRLNSLSERLTDLLELEGRSPSGDCLNKLNTSMELEGGTPEFKLMQMDERHQRWINTVTHQ